MDHSIPETHLDIPLDISPPPSLNVPLWRSLLQNFKDRYMPGALPPLQVTSQPVDVGMLLGDVVDLPWFRTVFTNLGDVISPETLPPLQLESRPVDVGELLSDQVAHPWWSSLLRNLADNVSPERLPALMVTSAPVKPEQASDVLNAPRRSISSILPRCSTLISPPARCGWCRACHVLQFPLNKWPRKKTPCVCSRFRSSAS